jgi:hypothetical protein
MPQAILPLFSDDMTIINNRFAVQQMDNTVYWFQGCLPVFCHHVHNEKMFRLFCCQLINMGNATAVEIAEALGVNREKLSRWARKECSPHSISPPLSDMDSIGNKKKPTF